MSDTVTHDVQTTVGAYLKEIPAALGHMDYHVVGDRVIAHQGDKTVVIQLTYEGERHLGSLDLPMTKVDVTCIGFSGNDAQEFHSQYNEHMMRSGGG